MSGPAFDHFAEPEPGRVVARADRMLLAVHEAGHVVVAHAFGLPMQGASVHEHDGGRAMIPFDANSPAECAVPSALRILAILAGNAATAVLLPDLHVRDGDPTSADLAETCRLARDATALELAGITNACESAGRDDDVFVAFCLLWAAENPPADDHAALAIYREAERDARRHVSHPLVRSAIEAVMRELLRRDSLTGDEIRAVIARNREARLRCS